MTEKIIPAIVTFLFFIVFGFVFILYENTHKKTSTIEDYSLKNCSYIHKPEKIIVCFDFNQDGKSMGAYATSSKTIFLRTIESKTIRHEALHHLLYRDTQLNEEQQHKFIEDLEIIDKEIFKIYYK